MLPPQIDRALQKVEAREGVAFSYPGAAEKAKGWFGQPSVTVMAMLVGPLERNDGLFTVRAAWFAQPPEPNGLLVAAGRRYQVKKVVPDDEVAPQSYEFSLIARGRV